MMKFALSKNPQMCRDYALYMLLSSEFSHAVCTSRSTAERLLMEYAVLSSKQQYKLEDELLPWIEGVIVPRLPEKFLSSPVTVQLRTDGPVTLVVIRGGGFTLRAEAGRYRSWEPLVRWSLQRTRQPQDLSVAA